MPSVPERKMAMMAAEKDIIMNEDDNSSDKDSEARQMVEHLSRHELINQVKYLQKRLDREMVKQEL